MAHTPTPAVFPDPTTATVMLGRRSSPVRGIILVGGRGTRLAPLTDTTPKPLLEVGGVPLVEHAIARLARAGIDDVTLALAFRPDDFLAAYPDGTCHGVRLRYSVEDAPLDTGGAIAHAARTSGIDDTFVVCNGDIIDAVEVADLLAAHLSGDRLATIELTEVDDPSAFGVVPTDAEGRVERFVEKPAPGTAPCNHVNAGTYVLEPEALSDIADGARVSVERETFPALAARRALYAHVYNAYWMDAGKVDTYRRANRDMADVVGQVHPTALVHPTASVTASSIGPRVEIGAGAVVVDSVVGAGCAIGVGARVLGSTLAPGVTVVAGSELVDVVSNGSAV